MPFAQFDRSKLNILPLEQRIHDIDISVIKTLDDLIPDYDHPALDPLPATW